jgi:hypothetical protein
MPSYWTIVNNVIKQSDVLLLLLDARLVNETRNREVEDKVRHSGKPLIYVITKCDLVKRDDAEKWKGTLNPCVFVSAKEHHGTTLLRERILMESKKIKLEYKTIRVGVLGYPNVGKSSLINSLKGRHSAPTSILSGYTKGIQKVRMDNRIMLLDTPGVIPYQEKDPVKHSFIGTLDFTKVKEPDMMVMELMQKFPGKIERHFGMEEYEDKEETIEKIALKKKVMMKGNKPDIERMARMILKDWQKGEIR